MKMLKKVFAVVLCITLFASLAMTGTSVLAEDAKTSVEGIRYFPCEAGRENDQIWEVECVREGCGCQQFDADPAETGNSSFLDTVYGEDGSLTITRNGNDNEEMYWPRIRTLMLESYPEMDINVANTLYFDFTVAEGTSWNMLLGINGMSIKLSKVVSDACGITGVANSDADGPAGTYKGSVNLQDAIAEIAKESGTESATFAVAMQNMANTYVPQIQIFCVGPVGASITINSLFISSADDTEGAKCDYLDMGLIFGDEYYEEAPADEEPADEEPADEEPADEEPADEAEETDDATKKTTTTKAADKDAEGGISIITIIIIAVAAVAVAAVVAVVIVVMKKKKA